MKGQNLAVFWCLLDPNFLCVKNKNVTTTTAVTPRSITSALNSKGFRASFQIGFNELLDSVVVTQSKLLWRRNFRDLTNTNLSKYGATTPIPSVSFLSVAP